VEASLPTKDGAVNKRIGEVRRALGMRQDEFAEVIKVSRSYIGALETSHREINNRIIELICVNCGANEKWLRDGTGKMFKDKQNPRLERVMRNFEKLDDYLQEFVIKQLDVLVECQEQNKAKK
jgi:transcriptional regulator with XRE-family HTH domain